MKATIEISGKYVDDQHLSGPAYSYMVTVAGYGSVGSGTRSWRTRHRAREEAVAHARRIKTEIQNREDYKPVIEEVVV